MEDLSLTTLHEQYLEQVDNIAEMERRRKQAQAEADYWDARLVKAVRYLHAIEDTIDEHPANAPYLNESPIGL